jgi:ubiquinone/menaquinone biosynthesis C-methylase UbiE
MTGVPEFYGRWAGPYDRLATAPGVGRWRRAAARRVADRGDTVVDLGCGSGATLPYLREQVGPDGRVVGLDVTAPLLDIARRRAAGSDNVSVLRADAADPPIRAADGAVATFVCGMFLDPDHVVDRWCDLVGSGGRVAVMDATQSDHQLAWPLRPLFRMATAAGTPGVGPGEVLRAPLTRPDATLDRRVTASREALVDRTVDRRYDEFALGVVGLLSGRVR